jgi:hypothetical protein
MGCDTWHAPEIRATVSWQNVNKRDHSEYADVDEKTALK